MNEQFTPGPWFYTAQPVPDYGFYVQSSGNVGSKTYIGDVGGGTQSKAEVEANATLIEAAPDLYYAAKKALDLLDRRLGAADGSLYTSEIKELKDALAKANPKFIK